MQPQKVKDISTYSLFIFQQLHSLQLGKFVVEKVLTDSYLVCNRLRNKNEVNGKKSCENSWDHT